MRTRPCREKGRKNKENRRKGKEEDGSAKEKGGKELGWCSIAALTVAFRQRFFFGGEGLTWTQVASVARQDPQIWKRANRLFLAN